jgi:hypothetical protein
MYFKSIEMDSDSITLHDAEKNEDQTEIVENLPSIDYVKLFYLIMHYIYRKKWFIILLSSSITYILYTIFLVVPSYKLWYNIKSVKPDFVIVNVFKYTNYIQVDSFSINIKMNLDLYEFTKIYQNNGICAINNNSNYISCGNIQYKTLKNHVQYNEINYTFINQDFDYTLYTDMSISNPFQYSPTLRLFGNDIFSQMFPNLPPLGHFWLSMIIFCMLPISFWNLFLKSNTKFEEWYLCCFFTCIVTILFGGLLVSVIASFGINMPNKVFI